MAIRPATPDGFLHRLGFMGPTGSGKSYTALRVALGLASAPDKVILGEFGEERGRHKAYVNAFPHPSGKRFQVGQYETTDAETYADFWNEAEAAGAEYIVTDQFSAEWVNVLREVDEAKARGGNEFAAWGEPSGKHDRAVRRMLRSPCHHFVVLRTKMKYVMVKERNKQGHEVDVPKAVGLKPVQRSGAGKDFTYELTGLILMSPHHSATIVKTMGAPGEGSLDGVEFPMAGDNLIVALRQYTDTLNRPRPEIEAELRRTAAEAVDRGVAKDRQALFDDIDKACRSPRTGDLLQILWRLQERLDGRR